MRASAAALCVARLLDKGMNNTTFKMIICKHVSSGCLASLEIWLQIMGSILQGVLHLKQGGLLCMIWQWRQVVTALSVPSSPPRSSVFIVVGLPKVCWAPSHPFLSPSLRPPKQIKSVASQVIFVIRILSGDKPSTLVPLLLSGSD